MANFARHVFGKPLADQGWWDYHPLLLMRYHGLTGSEKALQAYRDLIDQKKNEIIDQLLGGKEPSDGDAEEGETQDDADAVKSLLGGLLGGKKKKDDDSDGNQP